MKFETTYFIAKEELPISNLKKYMCWKLNMACNLAKHTMIHLPSDGVIIDLIGNRVAL